MLLTIHNLPIKFRYVDVKNLLAQKCGLSELILDNLVIEGATKKVTVGVSDDGDAAVLVRKINGLYVEGQQLYVEDVRKKRLGSEQPFRSEKVFNPPSIKQYAAEVQPVAMQTHVQTQYADSQAYISQNTIMQTNAIAVPAPYMMQGYGMQGAVYIAPQDTPMLALPDPQAHQQDNTAMYWNQQAQQWAQSANNSNHQDRPNQNPWRQPSSEERGSRWDHKERDWHPEKYGGNAGSQREEPPANFHGNPDYLARHAPPELLNKYQNDYSKQTGPEWQSSYQNYQDESDNNQFHGNNDGPSFGNHEGPPFGNREGPPFGNRDGPPFGNRDGPPFGKREGPPFGNRDGPPFGKREGPPFGNRDGPPFGNREGPSFGNRDGPSFGNGQRFDGKPRNFHKFDDTPPFSQKRKRAEEWAERKKFKEGSGFNAGPEHKETNYCHPGDTIPQRDRTWRCQAAAQISKLLASNEPPQVQTYYKRAVVSRLEKLMGDMIGVTIGEMISRYKSKYNDTNVLTACRRSYEADIKVAKENAVSSRPEGAKPVAKGAVGPVMPKGPAVQKFAAPDGKKKKQKSNAANIVVPGRIPNYPSGDKQIFKEAKKTLRKEFEAESTYLLDEPVDKALQGELDQLTAIITENCGTSDEEADPADNYVAERADYIAQELVKDGLPGQIQSQTTDDDYACAVGASGKDDGTVDMAGQATDNSETEHTANDDTIKDTATPLAVNLESEVGENNLGYFTKNDLTKEMPRQATLQYLAEDNTRQNEQTQCRVSQPTDILENELESNIPEHNANPTENMLSQQRSIIASQSLLEGDRYENPSKQHQIQELESNTVDMPRQSIDSSVSQIEVEFNVLESVGSVSNPPQTNNIKAGTSDKDKRTEDMRCETSDSQPQATEFAVFDQEDTNIIIKQEISETEGVNPEVPDTIDETENHNVIIKQENITTIDDDSEEQTNIQDKQEIVDVEEFDLLKVKLESLASKLQVSLMKPSRDNQSQRPVTSESSKQPRAGLRYDPRRGGWNNKWTRGEWGRLHRFKRVTDPRTGENLYIVIQPHETKVSYTTEEFKKVDNFFAKTDEIEVKKETGGNVELLSSSQGETEWSKFKVKQEKYYLEEVQVKKEILDEENSNLIVKQEELDHMIVVKQEHLSSDEEKSDVEDDQESETSTSVGEEVSDRVDQILWNHLPVTGQ